MIIGITGNSSVGKSFLIKNLELDFFLIDADRIGHKILQLEECKLELVNVFGTEILKNNEIDRKALGEIVFRDKKLLEILTKITHRFILEEIDRLINENNIKGKDIIIDAPLLIESGLHKKCDKTVLITASYSEKIKRIVERDSISEELAIARLRNQSDDSINKKYVDIVFENSYNLKAIQLFNELINQMKRVYYVENEQF